MPRAHNTAHPTSLRDMLTHSNANANPCANCTLTQGKGEWGSAFRIWRTRTRGASIAEPQLDLFPGVLRWSRYKAAGGVGQLVVWSTYGLSARSVLGRGREVRH